jgi:hypothetical protein
LDNCSAWACRVSLLEAEAVFLRADFFSVAMAFRRGGVGIAGQNQRRV